MMYVYETVARCLYGYKSDHFFPIAEDIGLEAALAIYNAGNGGFDCGLATCTRYAIMGQFYGRATPRLFLDFMQWLQQPRCEDPLHAACCLPRGHSGDHKCGGFSWSNNPEQKPEAEHAPQGSLVEKKPAVPCGFCGGAESLSIFRGIVHCTGCTDLATTYECRLRRGLVDTEYGRQEVVRYARVQRELAAEEQRQHVGARTVRDRICEPTGGHPILHFQMTSIEFPRPQPAEEIPLVGITPHYEWP